MIGPVASSLARAAAFAMSKETGLAIAAVLGGVATLTGAVCEGAVKIIEATKEVKKEKE